MSRNGTRDKLGLLGKLFPGYDTIVIQYKIKFQPNINDFAD